MVYDSIKKLVAYGVNTGLVEPEDEIYVTNRILEVMELDEYEEPEEIEDDTPLEQRISFTNSVRIRITSAATGSAGTSAG